MTDEQRKTGWLAKRREKQRLKRNRTAERAHHEAREGLPKQGRGAPRGQAAEGGHYDSGISGGGIL